MILLEGEPLSNNELEDFMAELLFLVDQYVYENNEKEDCDILISLLQNVHNTLSYMEMILCSKEKNISTAKLKQQLYKGLKIN